MTTYRSVAGKVVKMIAIKQDEPHVILIEFEDQAVLEIWSDPNAKHSTQFAIDVRSS